MDTFNSYIKGIDKGLLKDLCISKGELIHYQKDEYFAKTGNGKTGSYKFEKLETTQFDKGIIIPLDNDYFIPLENITHLQVDSKADINANLYTDLYISNSFTSLLPRMTPRPPLYRCIIMDWTHEYKEAFPTMEHVYLLHLVTTSN